MNGVYINQQKIEKGKPTPLKLGDVLGVGAHGYENEVDFYLYDVLKNVIKQEVSKNILIHLYLILDHLLSEVY